MAGWAKYDANILEQEIQNVVTRKCNENETLKNKIEENKCFQKNADILMEDIKPSLLENIVTKNIPEDNFPRVFVTSKRKESKTFTLFLFNNYETSEKVSVHKVSNVTILEAVRATSAAPSYFNEVMIDQNCFVDGGVGTNNPSLVALRECDLIFPKKDTEILFVSIGLGHPPYKKSSCNTYKALIEIIYEELTNCEKVHAQMNVEKDERENGENATLHYFRLNPRDDLASIALDDTTKVEDILKITERYLQDTDEKRKINEIISLLKENSVN